MAKSHCSFSGKMSEIDEHLCNIPTRVLTQLTVEEKNALVGPCTDMA
jgi:hypothetical protein